MKRSRRPTREELAAKRQALRETLDRKRSAMKRPERRRSWRRWVLLALLLLLLLFLMRDCRCNEGPSDEPVAEGVGKVGLPSEPPPPPPAPLTGRVDRVDRPEFGTAAPAAIPWLDSFRLQVAARSPRLAECFIGAERPGTLKWSALVEPTSGKVSDQTLEPTLLSDALTVEQRDCALAVLSSPPYRLQDDERSTPSRISMAIEF